MIRRASLGLLLLALGCGHDPVPEATLVLTLVDPATGRPTPARVELLDAGGEAVTPREAMPIRRPECFDRAIPDWLEGPREVRSLESPYADRRQFYVDGELATRLAPGPYRLRAFKGIEYRVADVAFDLAPAGRRELRVELTRWIDLPATGWIGADDHLHISRRGPEDDPALSRWMAAEDLHVANLLQGGNARTFDITPQYAFGPAGAYRQEGMLLLSGQEHPRTHLLGHTIVLGPREPIDLRDAYLLYERFWEEAERQGALAGYAHWGLGAGSDGLAVDAPRGLISFVEVLDFDYAHYDVWYDLLNLGLRTVPTAGTDYPCNPSTLPGRDRFYARVGPERGVDSWLAAVRRGETFVTNGPALQLEVAGVGIGGEVRLDGPGSVRVVGRVTFDPARDDVRSLELVQAGQPVEVANERSAPGEIRLSREVHVEGSTWFALRASGDKRGESDPPRRSSTTRLVRWLLPKVQGGAPFAERFERTSAHWPSSAHTAAIFVVVEGGPAVSEQPVAAETARRWLARLEDLRNRLDPEREEDLPIWTVPTGDGVALDVIARDRDALLAAIRRSERHYERQIRAATGDEGR